MGCEGRHPSYRLAAGRESNRARWAVARAKREQGQKKRPQFGSGTPTCWVYGSSKKTVAPPLIMVVTDGKTSQGLTRTLGFMMDELLDVGGDNSVPKPVKFKT